MNVSKVPQVLAKLVCGTPTVQVPLVSAYKRSGQLRTGVANNREVWSSIDESRMTILDCRFNGVVCSDCVHIEGKLRVRAQHGAVHRCLQVCRNAANQFTRRRGQIHQTELIGLQA